MLNPSVEVIYEQSCKISECMKNIFDVITDDRQSCACISGLIEQLELLCQMHFKFEDQLLEELNYPSALKQKKLNDSFLKAVGQFKTENIQCHTPSFFNSFVELRLDFLANMNNETLMLCDFILNNSSGDTTVTSH